MYFALLLNCVLPLVYRYLNVADPNYKFIAAILLLAFAA